MLKLGFELLLTAILLGGYGGICGMPVRIGAAVGGASGAPSTLACCCTRVDSGVNVASSVDAPHHRWAHL